MIMSTKRMVHNIVESTLQNLDHLLSLLWNIEWLFYRLYVEMKLYFERIRLSKSSASMKIGILRITIYIHATCEGDNLGSV